MVRWGRSILGLGIALAAVTAYGSWATADWLGGPRHLAGMALLVAWWGLLVAWFYASRSRNDRRLLRGLLAQGGRPAASDPAWCKDHFTRQPSTYAPHDRSHRVVLSGTPARIVSWSNDRSLISRYSGQPQLWLTVPGGPMHFWAVPLSGHARRRAAAGPPPPWATFVRGVLHNLMPRNGLFQGSVLLVGGGGCISIRLFHFAWENGDVAWLAWAARIVEEADRTGAVPAAWPPPPRPVP